MSETRLRPHRLQGRHKPEGGSFAATAPTRHLWRRTACRSTATTSGLTPSPGTYRPNSESASPTCGRRLLVGDEHEASMAICSVPKILVRLRAASVSAFRRRVMRMIREHGWRWGCQGLSQAVLRREACRQGKTLVTIWSGATLPPTAPTRLGSRASPTCAPVRDGCTWPSSHVPWRPRCMIRRPAPEEDYARRHPSIHPSIHLWAYVLALGQRNRRVPHGRH